MKDYYAIEVSRTVSGLSLAELHELLEKIEFVDGYGVDVKRIEPITDENGIFSGEYFMTISASCGGIHSSERIMANCIKCIEDLKGAITNESNSKKR